MEKVAIADESRSGTKTIQTVAITIGTCALVLLAFAVFKPDIMALVAHKVHYTVKGGSSPIIVSDGSTIITNNGGTFAIFGRTVTLNQPYYRPYFLSYECPLDAKGKLTCTPPPPPCTADSVNATACIVDFAAAQSWRLF